MNSTPSKRSVVLVDDEPGVLRALKMLLGALGADVRDFLNPIEALEFLRQGSTHIDLVMSDLRMPEIDGLELLKQLRSFNTALPFVLVSGHATEEDVAQAMAYGATDFLGKPFTPQQLKDALNKIPIVAKDGAS